MKKNSESNFETLYRSFIEHLPGITFQGNLDFTPIFFHGKVNEITGYEEVDFVKGKPRWDQIIHDDDISSVMEEVKNAFAIPNQTSELVYRIIRKDNQIRWVRERNNIMRDASGQPQFVQGIIFDITKEKEAQMAFQESENRLSTFIESATDRALQPDS